MSGPPGLSGEIPGAGVDADGAVASCVGRDRGARPRPGRHGPGGAGDGYFDLHDRARAERTAIARAGAVGPRAAPGGGRKRTVDKDPTLLRDLKALVEPTTSGAPHSPLRWTAKSTRTLARTLQSMGHRNLFSRVLLRFQGAVYGPSGGAVVVSFVHCRSATKVPSFICPRFSHLGRGALVIIATFG
jgi:hypothetical protein